MTHSPEQPPACGELMHLPPMHCSKPAGHDGNHATHMIPEPLSAVAAEMVSEHDRLLREREEFFGWRTREVRRLNVIRYAGYIVLTGAILALIFQWVGR